MAGTNLFDPQHLGDWQTTSAGGDEDEDEMFPLRREIFRAGALLGFCRGLDWRESRVAVWAVLLVQLVPL